MSFELLSQPIRKYVRDKRWEELRPIQHAAIVRIMESDKNFILASRTASGKTEAAFLPILSKIDVLQEGVQVLYISPLIALINDQFVRVEELCAYLDIPVTKWHGEAKRSAKEQLLKHPSGIVLITPESLEAMFVNKPYQVRALFSRMRYVIIDEIHSFIGTDRGLQLQSILSRLRLIHETRFAVIGLSATIGDYELAKEFTGDKVNTTVLLDKTKKEISTDFRYFPGSTQDLPLELLKDLYKATCDSKALIFPNSRGRAEEVAVKLGKIAGRVGGHKNYFSHHSSVDKVVREYVEEFAKHSFRQPFCICCTSTLELGIDIGSVDIVVQIDATNSIASLIQRVGRSGRRDGIESSLLLYTTDRWNLLQSLACWLLYEEGFIEPPDVTRKPFDILLHQALSIVKGQNGMPRSELLLQLTGNPTFKGIGERDINVILDHLIATDMLESLHGELLIGIEGEKIVNSREFYSVFITQENFKVVNAGNVIGEIPFTLQIREDENILLAAKVWRIKYVDMDAKRIEVIKAPDGKRPSFGGQAGAVHSRIREKMLDILFSNEVYEILDNKGAEELRQMRYEYSVFPLRDLSIERPMLQEGNSLTIHTFTGSRVNQGLVFLLDKAGISCDLYHESSTIEMKTTVSGFEMALENISKLLEETDIHLAAALADKPELINFSKYGCYLPLMYQVSLLKQRYFDFEGVRQVTGFRFVTNTPE